MKTNLGSLYIVKKNNINKINPVAVPNKKVINDITNNLKIMEDLIFFIKIQIANKGPQITGTCEGSLKKNNR